MVGNQTDGILRRGGWRLDCVTGHEVVGGAAKVHDEPWHIAHMAPAVFIAYVKRNDGFRSESGLPSSKRENDPPVLKLATFAPSRAEASIGVGWSILSILWPWKA